jgi:hypothetical protein|mmetsp:Transcript_31881/g.74769  ORF Transcript_31881/g.74769 Transcript_31881/m.74769 type:complete len:122 (-) Transcript_31881:1044-1409(-)
MNPMRNLLSATVLAATPAPTADAAPASSPEQRVIATLQRLFVASKDALLERIWQPEVRVAGRLPTLWAPDDFYIGARLSHCGVDSITLFATPEGWKVAGVFFSVVEAPQCAPSPLGAPEFK